VQLSLPAQVVVSGSRNQPSSEPRKLDENFRAASGSCESSSPKPEMSLLQSAFPVRS
jgi:hypothetical protein